ncbi:MAG: phosphatase PAP2 family protein [Peptococcaceae bacterium]|nr:MAG: phosphatase PAP2 family protein [Peptococcaceae bacterium]
MIDKFFSRNMPRKWTDLSYAGETRVPSSLDSSAYSWPMFFLRGDGKGNFTDINGNPVALEITHADNIDFEGKELDAVRKTLADLTQEQICIAEYWNAGPPTKQWTPIIDRLIDTYDMSPARSARILGAVHGGINDCAVITWHFKYHFNVARPNQLDQTLGTIVCTPYHPSYPSGHSLLAGCTEVLLGYFFSPEKEQLKRLAEECAISRLYGGVHYPADCSEGLRLGRQIGQIVVGILENQYDRLGCRMDYPITESRHAALMPPPYEQVIKYERPRVCHSKLDPRQCPEAR